jgi:peptidyl-tRNA hydrolase
VLSPIRNRDREQLDETLDRAADAVTVILSEGVERAMARFNERVKGESDG